MFSIEVKVTDNQKGARPRQFVRDFDGKQTLKDMAKTFKENHIIIAREVLREEQAKGFDKNPRVRIDNKFDRPLGVLKPFGKVEYFAKVDVSFALINIYEELERRSPVVTGTYRRGNVLLYNNVVVGDSLSQVKRFLLSLSKGKGFSENDIFLFVNVRPYARKLEYLGIRRGVSGKSKGRNFSGGSKSRKRRSDGIRLKVPNGTYFLTHRLARRKFKQLAKSIKFSFIPGNNSLFSVSSSGGLRTTFAGGRKGAAGRPYLYPSIKITLSGKGITSGSKKNVQ